MKTSLALGIALRQDEPEAECGTKEGIAGAESHFSERNSGKQNLE